MCVCGILRESQKSILSVPTRSAREPRLHYTNQLIKNVIIDRSENVIIVVIYLYKYPERERERERERGEVLRLDSNF